MEIPKGRLGRQYAAGNRDYYVTWNAREVLQFDAQGEGSLTLQTEQLVYIANEVPETFSVFLLVRILDGFSGVGKNDIVATFTLNMGVGKSVIRVPYGIAFDPTLAAPTEIYDLLTTPQTVGWKVLELPVQQLNIVASVTAGGTSTPTTVEVIATAAPRFRAHYLRETPTYTEGGGSHE